MCENRLNVVRYLLGQPTVERNVVDAEHLTALILAVMENRTSIVKLFLEPSSKVDVNFSSPGRENALHICVLNHNIPALELLLRSASIDPNGLPHYPSPLHTACKTENIQAIELLLAHKKINANIVWGSSTSTVLMAAILNRRPRIVRLLMAYLKQYPDIDINIKDKQGFSALHMAAQANDKEAVKLLLQHPRIKVDACSQQVGTPLFIASFYGHSEIVRLLVDEQADVYLRCQSNANALDIAVRKGHLAVVEILLAAKPNLVADYDNNGLTALYWAVAMKRVDCIQALCSAGKRCAKFDVNAVYTNTLPILFLPIIQENLAAFKILLACPTIDIHQRIRGYTALELAVESGQEEMVSLLREWKPPAKLALEAVLGRADDSATSVLAEQKKTNPTPVNAVSVVGKTTSHDEASTRVDARRGPIPHFKDVSSFMEFCRQVAAKNLLFADVAAPGSTLRREWAVEDYMKDKNRRYSMSAGLSLVSAAASQGTFSTVKLAETKLSIAEIEECASLGYYVINTPNFQLPLFAKVDSQLIKQLEREKPKVWSAFHSCLKDDLSYVGERNSDGIKKLDGSEVCELRIHGAEGIGDHRLLAGSETEKTELALSSGRILAVSFLNFVELATHENLSVKARRLDKDITKSIAMSSRGPT